MSSVVSTPVENTRRKTGYTTQDIIHKQVRGMKCIAQDSYTPAIHYRQNKLSGRHSVKNEMKVQSTNQKAINYDRGSRIQTFVTFVYIKSNANGI